MDSNFLLLSFISASLIVLIIPGPGVMYVVARSLSQGVLAGFVSALGLSVGVLAHVVATLIGLSAILLSSATAFTMIKFLGAGYLIYLGVQVLRSTSGISKIEKLSHQPIHRIFIDGVIVSTFNPKIAIFFLAFLPQFVNQETESATLQIASLGFLYALLALVTDSVYALAAVRIKNFLGSTNIPHHVFQYATGSLLIGLGLKAAFTSQRS